MEIKPAAEAMPAVSTRLPDVVLASFPQPECLLFELIETLHESHRTLPVIAITARCAPGQLVELLECGAAAHLRRQNLGELASLIRFAIDNPISHPPAAELEIIREPDSSGSHSWPTHAKCGSPAARHICERCSRIADASGEWERFNVFLRRNQKVTVTLGMCPDCARTLGDDHSLPVLARP